MFGRIHSGKCRAYESTKAFLIKGEERELLPKKFDISNLQFLKWRHRHCGKMKRLLWLKIRKLFFDISQEPQWERRRRRWWRRPCVGLFQTFTNLQVRKAGRISWSWISPICNFRRRIANCIDDILQIPNDQSLVFNKRLVCLEYSELG